MRRNFQKTHEYNYIIMSPERKLIFFSFSWEFRFDKLLRGPLIAFLNVEAVNRTNVAVLLDFLLY